MAERSSSQARTDSQARGVDLLTSAKGRSKSRCASVRTKDNYCVTNVSSVPATELVEALRWAEEPSRALGVAQGDMRPRVAPKDARAESNARNQRSKSMGRTKHCPSSTNHLSQTPFCSKGEERKSCRCDARASPRTRALWMVPRTSPCSAPRSVENSQPEGRVVTELD